ncbi:MAG: nucleoside monophosphate kinase [Candidatus Colwellbacteria bacterium]|nr:nucleoside monophosphate kinase [Candidatus Colwellbacteria bacterium]
MSKIVFLFGPPGSGKTTQAQLLARRFGFTHFDSGREIEKRVTARGWQKDATLVHARRLFMEGKLERPQWVLKITKEALEKLAARGKSIVMVGTPRTRYEAFGAPKIDGLIPRAVALFGRTNTRLVLIELPAQSTVKRNVKRGREWLDVPDVIKVRLTEYAKKTGFMLHELKRRGYSVKTIDGNQSRRSVFEDLCKAAGLRSDA